ncbi:MAG: V-type ATP synthase subunit E [Candidatus Heimdallarchaeota archaeon]|nr:V-type ATP synthase subunit E [Candidatus Heimdallarchaeota archaeon]MCK5142813.1 V-type ATP synthase subunit E [Candidatus Heimdallarchaeota archaeon]
MKNEELPEKDTEGSPLTRLIIKIKNAAEEEAKIINREAKQKLEEIEKGTKKLVDEVKKQELEKEKSRLDFIRKRTETEFEQKAKRIIIQARESIIDQVFEQVKKEMLVLRDNKGYSKYLENLLIDTIRNITAQRMKIIADKKDKEILNKITSNIAKKEKVNFKVDVSSLKTQGGFILTDDYGRIRIDYTIENTLKASRDKIRTKINEILFV